MSEQNWRHILYIYIPAQLLYSEIEWHCASDKKNIDWFLTSISLHDFDTYVMFCQCVQSFISLSNRFC